MVVSVQCTWWCISVICTWKCTFMYRSKTLQSNHMFRFASDLSKKWGKTKQNKKILSETSQNNHMFSFTSTKSKQIFENKSKQNKLWSKMTQNNLMFHFASNISKTKEAKHNKTSKHLFWPQKSNYTWNIFCSKTSASSLGIEHKISHLQIPLLIDCTTLITYYVTVFIKILSCIKAAQAWDISLFNLIFEYLVGRFSDHKVLAQHLFELVIPILKILAKAELALAPVNAQNELTQC